MQEFVSVEEARALVLGAVALVPAEDVPLSEALGRTLAEPVVSAEPIPPFANSGMDGYAVCAADVQIVPVQLHVMETIAAGAVPKETVRAGTGSRIMTGAPIPAGADAVVPVEWTEDGGGDAVRIVRSVHAGQNVRPAGQDVPQGAEVFAAGEFVTPPVVGMLAALGWAEVPVRVRPTVAVVATGDELVEPGQPVGPGQIRNANGPALAAQVRAAGGDPVRVLTAKDDPEDIRTILERALQADVLVFSGGVSVGQYDYVKQVLDAMGMRLLFWKVRQRPGKPLAFGILNGKPVFGLPGNPVSSSICFHQYVRPALAKMLGRRHVGPELEPAVLAAPISKAPGLHHFVRGRIFVDDSATFRVQDTGPQGSNVYTSVVQANGLIHLPEDVEDPPAGARVQVERLHW